ncbi:MAG TPA: 23S rRNA (pseudouridine(1915)-N(3))-methyltransferase RlmH, partial [Nannocystis sp.]
HEGSRVLLDERGEQIDTRELARWIDRWRRDARDVALYIGDADGFTATDRTQADRLLALSRLTLPHRLVRLILLEQLYRAGTLLAGHPYHHG